MVRSEHIRTVYKYLSETVVRRRTPATYEEICDILGLQLGQAYSYIRLVLERIFIGCDEKRLPPITSIVVGVNTINGEHGMPGSGYFVADAVSLNHAGRVHPPGIEKYLPN